MRTYEDKECEVVTRRECTSLICDMCGRKAEHPDNGYWEWGGAGIARGELSYHCAIDGDDYADCFDLCYEWH
jgi:hypothetical protein